MKADQEWIANRLNDAAHLSAQATAALTRLRRQFTVEIEEIRTAGSWLRRAAFQLDEAIREAERKERELSKARRTNAARNNSNVSGSGTTGTQVSS